MRILLTVPPFKSMLTKEGHCVDIFEGDNDFADALGALKNEHYDAAVISVQMNKGTGIRLLQSCRSAGILMPACIINCGPWFHLDGTDWDLHRDIPAQFPGSVFHNTHSEYADKYLPEFIKGILT